MQPYPDHQPRGQTSSKAASTVGGAFNSYDDTLNLDPRERARAQKRHQDLTALLLASGLVTLTFLQGSFARKTMRKPLKDVDMVVVLAERLRADLERPGGPARAMEMLRRIVAGAYPSASFDADGPSAHALQITFADLPFTFDLVPALAGDDGEIVHIANRELDRWEWSNARTLNRVVSERNVRTDGRFVHQVRMGKALKDRYPDLDLCGLAYEALAHDSIFVAQPHDLAVAELLRHASTAVLGKILEPTGVEDLTADWDDDQRQRYAQRFASLARRADEAVRLRADGAEPAAVDVWRTVFGDDFPAAPPQSASDALAALGGGSITSAGRAVTTPRANQPSRPHRSWRTR